MYAIEARRQQEELAEKLRNRRRQKMQAAAEKQAKTRAGFLSQADKANQAAEFIEVEKSCFPPSTILTHSLLFTIFIVPCDLFLFLSIFLIFFFDF